MNFRRKLVLGLSGVLLTGSTFGYELATHAYMTYRAYTRSDWANSQGDVQHRFGIDRLDITGPFNYDLPYSSFPQTYQDNQPAVPPALPPNDHFERDMQAFERNGVFKPLLRRGFIVAPVAGSSAFAGSDTEEVRFENTLPAWLMRGAIREDDY